jgi:hypothetical protein
MRREAIDLVNQYRAWTNRFEVVDDKKTRVMV